MNPTITISLDLSRVKSGLQEVQTDLGKISEPVEVEINTEAALANFRDLTVVVQGVISTIKGVADSINGLLDAALTQRQAEILTKIAFREAAESMMEFASEMQSMTNYGDEQLLPLMARMAQTFKLNADEVKLLTPHLISFTEANKAAGMSLETAFNLFGRALAGNTAMLGRYGIVLDKTRLEMEGVGYLAEKLEQDYGGVGEALADLRLQNANAWGDIKEVIGEILQTLVNPLLKGIKLLMDAYQSLSPVMQGFVGGLVVAIPTIVATATAVIALSKAYVMLKMAINPVVGIVSLVVAGLSAIAFGAAAASKGTKELSDSSNQLNYQLQQQQQQSLESIQKFDSLSHRLIELKKGTDSATGSKQELKAVVAEMQKGYGSYLRNINLEKASWQEVAAALSVARQQLTDYYVAQQTKAAFEGTIARIAELKRHIHKSLTDGGMLGLDIYASDFTSKVYRAVKAHYSRLNTEVQTKDERLRSRLIVGWWNEWQNLQKEINKELPAYRQALEKSFELTDTESATAQEPFEPVADSAKKSVDTALTEFEKLQAELKYYFQSELIRLFIEYKEKLRIIEENTAAGSLERHELMTKAKHWYDQELAILNEKRHAKRLADEASYYEEVKFLDANYYNWKVAQITKEVRQMDILTEKQDELLRQRIAALDKEKEAYERAPIDAIIAKYDEWKQKMANTQTVGVAAWQSIMEGLRAIKEELEAFKDVPDVAEIIENITNEIDIAQQKASQTKGSWFFSGILGFDPDSAEDQAKVTAIKDTYSNLNASISGITSGLLDINNQRKEEELARIEEIAEREGWSQERLLQSQKLVNKQYEAEEKRLKNIQKNISYVQAVINVAEGATKALAMGPVIGPIMASFISALGAVQIGIIKAQRFFRGGLFRGKGGPKEDANLAYISDGEYIVNAEATERHLPLLETINKGETLIPGYADGGLVEGQDAEDEAAKKEAEKARQKDVRHIIRRNVRAWQGIVFGTLNAAKDIVKNEIELGILKFAEGGLFRGLGGPTDDANIIAVSNGEYIVNAAATQKHGRLLEAINQGSVTYHTTSDNSELASLLKKVNDKLDILNLNLVKKDMTVNIQNTNDIESTVRKGDALRNQMLQLGYSVGYSA